MVSEGQRSASEAIVIAPSEDEPRSMMSGLELALLLLLLMLKVAVVDVVDG